MFEIVILLLLLGFCIVGCLVPVLYLVGLALLRKHRQLYIGLYALVIWLMGMFEVGRPYAFRPWFVIELLAQSFVLFYLLLAVMVPRYRKWLVWAGMAFPLSSLILYILPADLTDQEFPIYTESIDESLVPGLYVPISDPTTTTIALRADRSCTITHLSNSWRGVDSSQNGFDTFSGTWVLEKEEDGITRVEVFTSELHHEDPGHPVFDSPKFDITRQLGHPDYALVMEMYPPGAGGYQYFVRR